MEWCAPDNQIVLAYPKPLLTVLNIRDHSTGAYVERTALATTFNFGTEQTKKQWVEQLVVSDWQHWVESEAKEKKQIEGYVLRFGNSGLRVKLKTKWYFDLHSNRSSHLEQRNLFELVVDERADDLRALLHDENDSLQRIDEMEQIVVPAYNEMVQMVKNFHTSNKDLDRKEYMIKGQRELPREFFGLAAASYNGKEVDFKRVMKSRWEEVKAKL